MNQLRTVSHMQHFRVSILAILLYSLGAFTTLHASQTRTTADVPLSEVHMREIIVELDTTKGAKSVSAFCAAEGVKHVKTLPLSYATYQVIQVPVDVDYHETLAELTSSPLVKAVGPNVIKHVSTVVPNDPLFLNGATSPEQGLTAPYVKNNQWGLLITGCPAGWEATRGSDQVVVAIIDTGVNFDHEDLQGVLWTNDDEIAGNDIDDDENGFVDDVNGYDFQGWSVDQATGGDNDPTDPTVSALSHGTATSSIVAARGDNSLGIVGMAGGGSQNPGVRVMVIRVGTNTSITVDAEIGAIDYAVKNGAHIISMSFGGYSGGSVEEQAINSAWNSGLYVVAAAGNIGAGNKDDHGNPLVDLPAGFDKCVAVGATTIFSEPPNSVTGSSQVVAENLGDYSKTGPEMEIVAPGTHIMGAANGVSLYTDEVGRQFTGTSAATPLVAGLAALLKSANTNLTNQQIRDQINNKALDFGESGRDEDFGYGRIDVFRTLEDYITGKAGDTNGDGVVDENDVQPIIDHFGAQTGDVDYSASIDANNDGVIDELDLLVVGENFGS